MFLTLARLFSLSTRKTGFPFYLDLHRVYIVRKATFRCWQHHMEGFIRSNFWWKLEASISLNCMKSFTVFTKTKSRETKIVHSDFRKNARNKDIFFCNSLITIPFFSFHFWFLSKTAFIHNFVINSRDMNIANKHLYTFIISIPVCVS